MKTTRQTRRLGAGTLSAILLALWLPGHSAAGCPMQLDARFVESAPRDRFEFINRSTSDWGVARIELDLTTTAGQLLFDTQEGGSGVEVFQPYQVETSSARVTDAVLPDDGEQRLVVDFDRFGPGDTFAFTIDVDDRLADSDMGQIRVSGSEMQGGRLHVVFISREGKEARQVYHYDAAGRIDGNC